MHANLLTHLLPLALHLTPTASQTSGSGSTTRYWDCCKPSCAWPGKAALSSGPVTTCDINDRPLGDANARSGCEAGGTSYMCSGQSPWAVSADLAYGWAAATNTGADLGSNHFDLAIPGGGVGIYNACTAQYNAPPNGWGDQYGGIRSRAECDAFPEALKSGCYWRFDWFLNADNPQVNFRQVSCPAALTSRSGCVRQNNAMFR
ncbi:putative endoglucanase type K like protein [Verticillium longisporum]|nr:putative endoglucanase type K like protein [Verticillium longisporum]